MFRVAQAAHCSEETYQDRIARAEPRHGDLVYSREGTYFGIAAEVPSDTRVCLGQRMVLIRPDAAHVNFQYLRYWLNSPVLARHIHGFRDGTVAERLNLPVIRSLPILRPPLSVQAGIARILSALDDKIELNRRMNETLEAMARAIFKSRFVDFDPVHAKAVGRAPEGLDPATAALFPDSFEDSPLGKIPKGWRVRGLDEIADFLNGLALQKYPPTGEESLPVIKIAQLRKGTTDGANQAGLNVPGDYLITDGDVLFSWSGSLVLRIWCGGRGALNQHLFKVTSREYPRWFYYLWVDQHLQDFRAIAAGKATTMGHIQRHHLTEALTVVPDEIVLEHAGRTVSPLVKRIVANTVESRTLAAIRDALLPKLLSGELRVQDTFERSG